MADDLLERARAWREHIEATTGHPSACADNLCHGAEGCEHNLAAFARAALAEKDAEVARLRKNMTAPGKEIETVAAENKLLRTEYYALRAEVARLQGDRALDAIDRANDVDALQAEVARLTAALLNLDDSEEQRVAALVQAARAYLEYESFGNLDALRAALAPFEGEKP